MEVDAGALDQPRLLVPAVAGAVHGSSGHGCFGRSVDLVSLRRAPPLLRFEIARDGQLLIERDPHAWVEFRAHAMIDWWDWAPTARIMHRAVRSRLEREATRGSS